MYNPWCIFAGQGICSRKNSDWIQDMHAIKLMACKSGHSIDFYSEKFVTNQYNEKINKWRLFANTNWILSFKNLT